MTTDFFSLLTDSNSIIDEDTGEITLTVPKIESHDIVEINTSCKISSNCNTILSGPTYSISSETAYFRNITFETPIEIESCSKFTMIDCNITNIKSDIAILIEKCKSVELSQINITNIETEIGIQFDHSNAIANNLFINGQTQVIIAIIQKSSLQILDSKLSNSKSRCFSILNSQFEIQNCIISDTINPAIYAWNSRGKIMNNQISNLKMNGIVINNSDSIEIFNNKITDVNGSAISIINNSKCEIHHNSISKIESNGLFINNKSKVNLHHNELSQIRCPAIAILMKSKANLTENKISDINSCGIRINNAKEVEIDHNEINNIKECAISVLNTKKCNIKNNTISDCHIAAVEVYNQSKANVYENVLSNLGGYAFMSYALGDINAENNTISNVGKSMTKLIYKGGGQFINNKLANCPQQKEGETSSKYYFNKNENFQGITNDESKKEDSIQYDEKIIENNNLCIKCNHEERKCFLLNCGHKVYCQKCAEEALKNGEKCPVCRLPIFDINEGFTTEDDTCNICCEKKADCMVMPCGHIGFCQKCLDKWFHDNRRCLYCQIEPVSYSNIQDI